MVPVLSDALDIVLFHYKHERCDLPICPGHIGSPATLTYKLQVAESSHIVNPAYGVVQWFVGVFLIVLTLLRYL